MIAWKAVQKSIIPPDGALLVAGPLFLICLKLPYTARLFYSDCWAQRQRKSSCLLKVSSCAAEILIEPLGNCFTRPVADYHQHST
ncbi:hypothetical protein YSA_09948 [Pseudomonas putida ND6]|uniref:Uncharacterized protein n=1 Tax=Pseudomonas putida ND6 TaxID=231023 RepID=I3V349_PSEPU|nr:hypothetical protein YSA_09948 [Pseudomonas putida ND6]